MLLQALEWYPHKIGRFLYRYNKNRLPKKAVILQMFQKFGGDKRDRTADLLNAIQALSRIMDSMPAFLLAEQLDPQDAAYPVHFILRR